MTPSKLPVDSHVRVLHPSQNEGVRILRRGYNFVDGTKNEGYLVTSCPIR